MHTQYFYRCRNYLLLLSKGTTGEPKLIEISQRAIASRMVDRSLVFDEVSKADIMMNINVCSTVLIFIPGEIYGD